MKKIYTFLLSLCLLSMTQAHAQTEFAPVGAKWTYHGAKVTNYVHYWIGGERLSVFECTESNLLNGHNVKKIKEITYTQKLSREISGVQYFNRDTTVKYHEIYQSGDTVYYNNPIFQRYTPLYVFNVQDGDTLRLPITDTNYISHNHNANAQDSIMSFVIDSVRTVNYNGTLVETYYTTSLYDSIQWNTMQGMVLPVSNTISNWSYESFFNDFIDPQGDPHSYLWMKGGYTKLWGGLGAGIIPINYKCYPQSTGEENNRYLTTAFNCYTQGSTSIHMNVATSCEDLVYINPLGLNDRVLTEAIKVYPNPAKGVLYLKANADLGNHASVSIIDMLGKVVVPATAISSMEQRIEIAHLAPGIYMLQIEKEGRRGYQKISVR